MYFVTFCREEPDRSFSSLIAVVIISSYLGCSAGFFGVFFLAAGLVAGASDMMTDYINLLTMFSRGIR